jgi:uncharacterized protein (UPF0261 family)
LSSVGLTCWAPFTQPASETARRVLEENGHSVDLFEADGVGGGALEIAIRKGRLDGVLDLTLSELAANLVGGPAAAGPDRLTGASLRGLPQVVCFGGLDLISLGSGEFPPERFRGRRWIRHGGGVVLRTNPEENDKLGKEIAYKVCSSTGLVGACLPRAGLSSLDVNGHSFRWQEANDALFESFFSWIGPQVKTLECATHINDPVFAKHAAMLLVDMLSEKEDLRAARPTKQAHE